jgi:sensor c-di-GMP phosphodiesterase-like protein
VRHSAGIGLAIAVGAAAIAMPILISVQLAWRQSVSSEQSRVLGYAQDAVRRGNEAGAQTRRVFQELTAANLAPCSAAEIDLMRRLDVSSSYLQAVGRINGNSLTCTSLGTTEPIDVGPPTIAATTGLENRLNVRIPSLGNQPLAVVSQHGFAVLIDTSLPLDTTTEGPDVSLSIYFPSSPSGMQVIAGHGQIRPEWYRAVARGSKMMFVDSGYVVCIARSDRGDIAAVAAAPRTYVARQVGRFATIFIPIGVLCGMALAGTVAYISRMRLSLPSVLRGAARRREFFVEYQPVIELATGRWVGAEALVRWKRGGKVVSPNEFIPTAEASGMVPLITRCVAEKVAEDLPCFLQLDPNFSVAINLSATDLRLASTLPLLARTLKQAGARPHNLQVEATEGGFLQGEQTQKLVDGIRALGIRVALDDFGTGYSSLSRLETLRPDALKIDKSFVDTIGTDGATSQVVPHIIEMGHSLHLEIVAEGVETKAQADFLRKRGVTYAQGWLFGKAIPLKEFCESLTAQKPEKCAESPATLTCILG